MTVRSVGVLEPPRSGAEARGAPVHAAPDAGPDGDQAGEVSRLARRADRRRRQRERRLWALAGLAVLACSLGLAVVALDLIR